MSRPAEKLRSHFTGIKSADVPKYWELLVPLIEKPLRRTGADKYYTPDDVLMKCVNCDWQCWIAWSDNSVDCVFITYVTPHPTGWKSFGIYLVGGSKIDQWLDEAWTVLKAYAKKSGCHEIVGGGRQGWLRALKRVEPRAFEQQLRFSVRI